MCLSKGNQVKKNILEYQLGNGNYIISPSTTNKIVIFCLVFFLENRKDNMF